MKRIVKCLTRNIHWAFYAVFLGVQAFGHAFLVLFGDDYYYANFIPRGWDYFVSENIFHYTDTNGRFFVHLIDELLLGVNMVFWKIFNLAVIAAVVLFAAKITAKTYKNGYRTREFKISLIASVFLFSAISEEIYINCIYWATGAVNYLFPVALVLVYFYYSKKDLDLDKGYKWLPLLAFFASFTVEQSSAAAFAISVYVIVTCIFRYKRKVRPVYFVSLGLSFFALCSVVFAPGNSVRTTYYPEFYELSFFGKILHALHTFLYQIFGPHGLFLLFVILSLFCVSILLRAAKKQNGKKRVILVLLAIIAALSLLLYIWFAPISNSSRKYMFLAILFACVPLGIYFIYTVAEYFKGDDDESVLFVLLAILLQLVMLVSPVFGYRTVLISAVLLFIPSLKGILAMSQMLAGRVKKAVGVISVLIVVASFLNPIIIGLGYMENYPVHVHNAEMMEKYVAGEIDEVKLAYPINDKYRYTMPYEGWYNMMRYMELYGLPKDMVVEFEKYGE